MEETFHSKHILRIFLTREMHKMNKEFLFSLVLLRKTSLSSTDRFEKPLDHKNFVAFFKPASCKKAAKVRSLEKIAEEEEGRGCVCHANHQGPFGFGF